MRKKVTYWINLNITEEFYKLAASQYIISSNDFLNNVNKSEFNCLSIDSTFILDTIGGDYSTKNGLYNPW